jgi:hypothetical protein
MKRFLTTKKGVVALLATIVAVAVSAFGAYAYFTSSGEGSGTAKVGTSTTWQVDTLAYAGGPLTPGGGIGTHETVDYNVTNNSTGQQNLANVNIKVATATGAVWSNNAAYPTKPACTAGDFQISLDGGTSWAVAGASADDTELAGNRAPGSTTANATITLRMIDTGANQDNCKNLDVPLYLYAT